MASAPRSPRPWASTAPLAPRTLEVDGGLRLRPLHEADEAAVARAMADPQVLRWAAGLAVNAAPAADRARVWLLPRLTGWAAGVAPFAVVDTACSDAGFISGSGSVSGSGFGPGSDSGSDAGSGSDPGLGPDGTLLGYVGLRDINRVPDQAVAAYWVTPAARGRRIGARALDAVARWAFAPTAADGLGLHRLSLDHSLANEASCRVALAAGFRPEGTARQSFLDPAGERHDSHLHARLASDPTPAL
jgi:RimJ/RimL family protein N-acetyltransferase